MEIERTRTGIEQKLYEMALRVVGDAGYTLYEMDYITGSKTMRVFILDESTGTAVIEDCIKVDHAFTPYFEESEWIPEDITLEVSSPGMFRPLKTIEHFNKALNERVSIHLSKEFSKIVGEETCKDFDKKIKKTKNFVCELKEVHDDGVTLSLDDNFELKINYKDIKKANLEPEI